MRLRRTNPGQPGFTLRRRGRGWSYQDRDGATITDPVVRARIDALAIPPAWHDVWITPFANGHLQWGPTVNAGRRQYLYHADGAGRSGRRGCFTASTKITLGRFEVDRWAPRCAVSGSDRQLRTGHGGVRRTGGLSPF